MNLPNLSAIQNLLRKIHQKKCNNPTASNSLNHTLTRAAKKTIIASLLQKK